MRRKRDKRESQTGGETADLETQLAIASADLKKAEEQATERFNALNAATAEWWVAHLERERLNQVVDRLEHVTSEIATHTYRADECEREADEADQQAAEKGRHADAVATDPTHVSTTAAKVEAAELRLEELAGERREAAFVSDHARLDRLAVQRDSVLAELAAAQAAQQALSEQEAEAGSLRSEAAALSEKAAEARARAVRHRAQAAAAPEEARRKALAEYEDQQRLQARPRDKKPAPDSASAIPGGTVIEITPDGALSGISGLINA